MFSQTPVARKARKITAGIGLASVMAVGGIGVHLATSEPAAATTTGTSSNSTSTSTGTSTGTPFGATQSVSSGSSTAQTTTGGS